MEDEASIQSLQSTETEESVDSTSVVEAKSEGEEKKLVAASAKDGKEKSLRDRTSHLDKARLKLRQGWRNDAQVLNQYFQSCVTSWKVYKGERIPKQVMKVQSIYRQAIHGDNTTPMPQNLKSVNGIKWQAWMALKGMTQEMAKRRFITYLAEINPKLIDVMPDEKPPDGFCKDVNGVTICAKCNTFAGCSRPILDQYKVDLRDQLYDSNDLHEPGPLKKWVRNALANQQCIFGVHKPVLRADIKPFAGWFAKEENGGYRAYQSEHVYMIIKELLTYHFEIGYDMQCNLSDYSAEAFNAQSVKVGKLKSIYQELSGERYVFEAPCRNNNDLCNELREAEGRNHTHPVDLLPPTHQDVDDYESSIELRKQCQKLGLNCTTGVVENVQERCSIYRTRIASYFEGLKVAGQAAMRLNKRIDIHAKEKKEIKSLGTDTIQRQASDACHSMKIDHVLTLICRGCNPNVETNRGLTPMLTAVITQATTEMIEELVQRKCDLNAVNMYGLTPLMLACRMKDTKVIHSLMRMGASALQTGGKVGQGYTAMHWCAIHGSEEEAKIILEYVKEGGGDSLRMSRVLDCVSDSGDTPLMLAARIRNGLMCKVLSTLGANPNIRNDENRNACTIARTAGWTELANWLEKKVGAGVAKLETYSDQQYDKMVRFGKIRSQENIEEFGRLYLSLVYHSTTVCPLGPPSIAQTAVADIGNRAFAAQLELADNHQLYIHSKDIEGKENQPKQGTEKANTLEKLSQIVNENILSSIQQGKTGPNTEALATPLPWTPLMCATALNNVRTIRLMVREGASPNHKNMQGTTPLMLAAQLQNLDALIELLVLGADIKCVDNFGYTALAYATSLPIPQLLNRDEMNFIMDAETDAPKKRDAASVLKLALTNGIGVNDIKEKMKESEEATCRKSVENHFRFMRLLESYGLTRMQTAAQLGHALNNIVDRMGEDDHVKIEHQEFSETTSEAHERELIERHRAEQLEHMEPDEPDVLRCPICTLTVPCPHFFKAETLQKFMDQNAPEPSTSTGSALQDMLNAATMRKNFAASNKERERQKILKEVGIEDRNSDRSIAFSKKYRLRERELDRLAKERHEALVLKQKIAQEAEDAMDQGIGWKEYENKGKDASTDSEAQTGIANSSALVVIDKDKDEKKNTFYYVHDITQVRWDAIPDQNGQTYYHNPATNETLWDVPGLAEWIVKNNQDKAEKEEKAKFMAEAQAAKEARRAARDAKKAEKEAKKAGKLGKGKNTQKVVKTGADHAREAAEKEAKEKNDALKADMVSDTIEMQRAIAVAAEKAENAIDLGGDKENSTLLSSAETGMVTPQKKKAPEIGAEIFTPKSILKVKLDPSNANNTDDTDITEKDVKISKKEKGGIRFIEGDIDPKVEVRKDWNAMENGDATVTPTGEDEASAATTEGDSKSEDKNASEAKLAVNTSGNSDDAASTGSDIDGRPRPGSPGSPVGTKGEGAPLKLLAGVDKAGELSDDIFKGLSLAHGREAEHGEVNSGVMDIFGNEIASVKDHEVHGDGSLESKIKHDDGTAISEFEAMENMQEKELTEAEKFEKRKSTNPYPPEDRRLFSFTKESMLKNNHLLRTEKDLTEKQHKRLVRDNTNKFSLRKVLEKEKKDNNKGEDEEELNLAPSYEITRKAKRRSSAPKALMRKPLMISLSGWVFVSISSPDIQPPMDKVELPLEMWANIVEYLREKFDEEHVSRLRLRSMVSPNTIKVITPRCSACKVGFVRTTKNTINKHDKNDICFACIVRKELYTRAQQVFPRTLRRKLTSQWPFREKSEFDDEETSTDLVVAGDNNKGPLSPLTKRNNTLDSGSPVHSTSLAEMDVRETVHDMVRDKQNLDVELGHTTVGNITVGVDDDGSLKTVVLGKGSKPIELEGTSGDALEIFGDDTDNNKGKGKGKRNKKKEIKQTPEKLPEELSLLPFLLAKGQYDDVDRIVRVTVAQKTVDEGSGALFLVGAMAIQADMYKMMGLYSLALGTYLECFDITVSILGFNSVPAMNAMQWISSCLVKMRCPALSKEWCVNVCRSLETESLSTNMFEQSKVLLDADRALKKTVVKNEYIWLKKLVPVLQERESSLEWNHPSRDMKFIIFKYLGYPAVYRTFASIDGYSLVAKQSFVAHCVAVEPLRLGKYAQFVLMCFELRIVDNLDTSRHLIQQMIQKFLAASLEDTCEVAQVYRQITSEDDLHAVQQFLNFGLPVEITVFDEILFHSLKVLGNCGEYTFFYLRDGACGLRDRNPEDAVLCFNAIATKIQIVVLQKLARIKCNKIRAFNEEERLRKLAEYNEMHGIKEETEEEAKARKKAEKKAAKKKRQQELMDMGLSIDEDM